MLKSKYLFESVTTYSVCKYQNKITCLSHWLDIFFYPNIHPNLHMNQSNCQTRKACLFKLTELEETVGETKGRIRNSRRELVNSASTFARFLLMSLDYYYPIMPQSPDGSLLVIVPLLRAKDGGNWRYTVGCYHGARIFFLLIHYSS